MIVEFFVYILLLLKGIVQVFMNRIITGSYVSARPAKLTYPSWSSCLTRQLHNSALPVDDSFR